MTGYSGKYNDGQSAASRSVTVQLQYESLWILDDRGKLIADWPFTSLRPVDELAMAKEVRLRCDGEPEARLLVEDPDFLTELGTVAPQFRLGAHAVKRSLQRAGIAAVGIAAVVALFWFGLPKGVEALARVIPVSWEERLGEAALGDVIAFFGQMADHDPQVCEAPAGKAALDRLVGRLTDVIDTPYEFKVQVVDLDITNAFALPGGYIVIFEGLIESSKSAEEVAGVLAHEMGHVIHRHSTQGMLRQMGISLIFDVMMGDFGGTLGGQIGSVILTTSYGREAETQADVTGIEVLQSAGIKPGGLAAFFRRLQKEDGDIPAAFQILSTHPSFAQRLKDLEKVKDEGAPAMSADDWKALQGICALTKEPAPEDDGDITNI